MTQWSLKKLSFNEFLPDAAVVDEGDLRGRC